MAIDSVPSVAFAIRRGQDWTNSFEFVEDDEVTPVNLTGYSFYCTIHYYTSAGAQATLTPAVAYGEDADRSSPGSDGFVWLILTDVQSLLFTIGTGKTVAQLWWVDSLGLRAPEVDIQFDVSQTLTSIS